MKNRTRKRLIDWRHKLPSRFVKSTLRALAEAKAGKLTAYQYGPLIAEERAWDSMAPIGREFGSPDYERLTRLDDEQQAIGDRCKDLGLSLERAQRLADQNDRTDP